MNWSSGLIKIDSQTQEFVAKVTNSSGRGRGTLRYQKRDDPTIFYHGIDPTDQTIIRSQWSREALNTTEDNKTTIMVEYPPELYTEKKRGKNEWDTSNMGLFCNCSDVVKTRRSCKKVYYQCNGHRIWFLPGLVKFQAKWRGKNQRHGEVFLVRRRRPVSR